MFPDDRASTSQHLLHWARTKPDSVAVIEADRVCSYRDLAQCVVQYATALRVSGVRAGMLVGLASEHRTLHLALILACDVIRATSVSLSGADVADRDEALARCDFLCVSEGFPLPSLPAGRMFLTRETIDRISGLPIPPDALRMLDMRRDDADVVRLARTSGSTGRAKVMAVSQANLGRMTRRTRGFGDARGYDNHFINLYNFTLRSAFIECSIALRAGQVIVSSYMETIFADIDRFASARMTLMPRDAVRMVEARPRDWAGPRRCKLYVSGGGMPANVHRLLKRDFVTDVHFVYGTMETHWLASLHETGEGDIMPDAEIRVVNHAGQPVAPGETGLIEARTPVMVDGYLWNERATEAAFAGGWYRTNDVGMLPGPGRLVVLGRADNMLNIGGVKVAPEPLEARIRLLPGVGEAVIVSEPGALGMRELTVVLEPGPGGMSAAIRDDVAAIVGSVSRGFRIRIAHDLPRTPTGKVRRNAL